MLFLHKDSHLRQQNPKAYLLFVFIFIYFTLLGEQDEAYINLSSLSMLVGLEPTSFCKWVTNSTTELCILFMYCYGTYYILF